MINKDLIVALDVPNKNELINTLNRLPDIINWYKVGLELFIAEGPEILKILKSFGKQIFLDLKLHDIPQTVENAINVACQYDVDMMTVHGLGGKKMLEAAANAASNFKNPPKLVAVTTLTSLGDEDLNDIGISKDISSQALSLGSLAISSGIDGLVTSAFEAKVLRDEFPSSLLITPGIRLKDDNVNDQKRVATPDFALRQGATHLVVGRSILKSNDPLFVVENIMADIKKDKLNG
jgi:orotidine-5'-phosphate decarboxylase